MEASVSSATSLQGAGSCSLGMMSVTNAKQGGDELDSSLIFFFFIIIFY